MEILKNKEFARWAKEEEVSDEALIQAISEMKNGLYDANLGGGVYKKRIPLCGRGKRGGARTIVAFKLNNKAIFIYGYAKNERATISPKEQEALKFLSKLYFSYSDEQISKAIKTGELIQVIS